MTHHDSHDHDIPDARLDALLADARETWHVAPEPSLDEMWGEIEAAHFDGASGAPAVHGRRGTPSWRVLGMAMAATLVIGIGIGRWSTATKATVQQDVAAAPSAPTREPGPV